MTAESGDKAHRHIAARSAKCRQYRTSVLGMIAPIDPRIETAGEVRHRVAERRFNEA
jgi:hypothetical protein